MRKQRVDGSEFYCVGQIVADVLVRPVERLPKAGTAKAVEDLDFQPGGCATNTAVVLARLGARVSLFARAGTDAWGEAVARAVAASGVDVRSVRIGGSAPTTACTVVVSASGERTFLYRPGGNEAMTVRDIVWRHIRGGARPSRSKSRRFFHIGGAMKMFALDLPAALRRARAAGCRTSIDTDWDTTGRWMERLGPALPHVDCLIAGIEEAKRLAGASDPQRIADFFLARGPSVVAVKQGPMGSSVATREEPRAVFVPAFRVKVVDTTGAGDAYAAGFLWGLKEGWDAARAALFANACGALATTALGASAGVVSLAQVERLVKKR